MEQRSTVQNFTSDEWTELQNAIKVSCELNDPTMRIKDRARKKSAGTCKCGACTLKKSSRTLAYLVYWKRHRADLLVGEGLDEMVGVLV